MPEFYTIFARKNSFCPNLGAFPPSPTPMLARDKLIIRDEWAYLQIQSLSVPTSIRTPTLRHATLTSEPLGHPYTSGYLLLMKIHRSE